MGPVIDFDISGVFEIIHVRDTDIHRYIESRDIFIKTRKPEKENQTKTISKIQYSRPARKYHCLESQNVWLSSLPLLANIILSVLMSRRNGVLIFSPFLMIYTPKFNYQYVTLSHQIDISLNSTFIFNNHWHFKYQYTYNRLKLIGLWIVICKWDVNDSSKYNGWKKESAWILNG